MAPIEPDSLEGVLQFAQIALKANHFGLKNVEDAAFRILYGRELGLTVMQSMMGIDIIQGRPGPKAGTVAALIQNSGRFAYRIKSWTETECIIDFFEKGEHVGESKFTIEDATKAKLVKDDSNWKKYPRAMLFARALTQGARAYCPSVTMGPVYSSEELSDGFETIETTAVAPAVSVTQPPVDPQPPKEPEVDPITDKIRRYDAWATDVAKRLDKKGFAAFKTSGAVTEFIYNDISGAGFADGAAKSYRDRVKAIASLDMEWKELLETLNAIALRLLGKLEQEAAELEPGSEG